jgi:predicted enzyme related to lactoylglutathione lyase
LKFTPDRPLQWAKLRIANQELLFYNILNQSTDVSNGIIQKRIILMMSGLLKSLVDVSHPVSNWQKSKKFYAETLGLPVAAFISDEVGWMEFGEKDQTHLAISLWQGPEPFPTQPNVVVAVFSVENAYDAIDELRKRGVRCEDVVAIPSMVTFANFYDPDGNRLQVAGPPP